MRRSTSAPVAAALMVALTGCGVLGGDGADGSGSAGGTGGDVAESHTSIDPALLECGATDDDDAVRQLEDVVLTGATWEMPAGFAETFKYSEDMPVEHIESFWAAEPATDPVDLNVLAVVVYSELDWGADIDECGRVAQATIDARLARYRDAAGAEPLTELAPLEIAGLPALQQDLALPEYSYRGYWVFSRSQLIHLYCQWTSDAQKERVLTGCDELVSSLVVPGA
jgi:hypothetical protein